MADLLAEFGRGGPLADMSFAGEPAALLGTWIAFSPLRRLSEKPEQRATALSVVPDEAVNRLVAEVEAALEAQPAADLLGTQILA